MVSSVRWYICTYTVPINFSHSDWLIAWKYQAVFSELQSALLMIKRLGDNDHVRAYDARLVQTFTASKEEK